MSKPLNYFLASIERAKSLVERSDQSDAEGDDILRAAAVIAVAAYDHYFTSKFCDVLSSYLRSNEPNNELVDLLSRAGLNTKSAIEIAVMKRPFRRIRALISSSLSEKTTNRSKSIDNLFTAIELYGLTGRVLKETKRKKLGVRIDKLVDLRNEIVHFAHLNSHGKPKKISKVDVGSRISEVKLFVETSERIINEWVKSKKLPSVSSVSD